MKTGTCGRGWWQTRRWRTRSSGTGSSTSWACSSSKCGVRQTSGSAWSIKVEVVLTFTAQCGCPTDQTSCRAVQRARKCWSLRTGTFQPSTPAGSMGRQQPPASLMQVLIRPVSDPRTSAMTSWTWPPPSTSSCGTLGAPTAGRSARAGQCVVWGFPRSWRWRGRWCLGRLPVTGTSRRNETTSGSARTIRNSSSSGEETAMYSPSVQART